ncbi:fatty acid hydroxylase superfamily-domain-containing protein [Gigaspora rosea]|uniref:Fatty acid hydroxylase superfamily-domain-containing protein n=1 Tax=Gigaspora rosea TaxID=44941 RepID=A0A397V845_9GLOM|nr:fatty acid hydroxylase superfamily-domain-containing protein [Gigaspora rosea]
MDKNSTTPQHAPFIPIISDKHLSLLLPIIIYWVYSGMYHLISKYQVPFFEKYRIRSLEETETRNKVSTSEVIKGVIVQQFLQTVLGFIAVATEEEQVLPDDNSEILGLSQTLETYTTRFGIWHYVKPHKQIMAEYSYWYLIPVVKFFLAMFLLDTWQYFMHRLFHQSAFLYRHIHSRHHRLYAPYAFGALYNHPIEGFLFDSLGAVIAFTLSGLSVKGAIVFFAFSTFKTVDDHSGYDIPFNPIQRIFGNNAIYHDIHHQTYGLKKNFSQPFFTFWDRIFGTYLPSYEASKLLKENPSRGLLITWLPIVFIWLYTNI